jgi:hypothetical protein
VLFSAKLFKKSIGSVHAANIKNIKLVQNNIKETSSIFSLLPALLIVNLGLCLLNK